MNLLQKKSLFINKKFEIFNFVDEKIFNQKTIFEFKQIHATNLRKQHYKFDNDCQKILMRICFLVRFK